MQTDVLFFFFHVVIILCYIQKRNISILTKPVEYYKSMKGKNTRSILCEYFGQLYFVPKEMIEFMKWLCNECHNASLVIDDIQDNSVYRRNMPCAHIVYGISNTLNAGYLCAFRTLAILPEKARVLLKKHFIKSSYGRDKINEINTNIECIIHKLVSLSIENIHNMHVGQGLDIYWSTHQITPSMDEYYLMIEYKTGILFSMIIEYYAHVMSSTITDVVKYKSLSSTKKLCHFFQIRDDYINITDELFWKQKGFCEDFDEKKQTYPIILFYHDGKIPQKDKDYFFSIFYQSELEKKDKFSLLQILDKYHILNRTYSTLVDLKQELECEICIPYMYERLVVKPPCKSYL